MSEAERLKRQAAERAAAEIRDGMRLGLGTGSTVRHLLDVIAERRRAGDWQQIVGVPTSEDTHHRAAALGIPLATLAEQPRLDLTIDGADEVAPDLGLIKGLGGALLREKIVASVSDRLVIVADASKRVDRLGTRAPLPVEVDPFAAPVLESFFVELGATPALRRDDAGAPFVSDGGHWIVDCRFAGGIDDAAGLARSLAERPGVIEHGLFLSMADLAVIAAAGDVEILERARGA